MEVTNLKRHLNLIITATMFICCGSRSAIQIKLGWQEIAIDQKSDVLFGLNLPDGTEVKIISDTVYNRSILSAPSKGIELQLGFFMLRPYLGSVYYGELPHLGHVLVIESYIPGASGLAAQITNVSIINIEDTASSKVISYNSFYGGIKQLSVTNEDVIVEILKYCRTDIQRGVPVICSTKFKIEDSKFKKLDYTEKCYINSHDSLIAIDKSEDCIISQPFVY